MKIVYRIRDNRGGKIEVYLLERNNEVPEDLIWLHAVTIKNKKKEENGMAFRPDEARYVIHGLFLAIDRIIEEYKLEKFKAKKKEKV